ncbi:Uncharacterized protein Fot_00331 [Forsythia ovata]|uniref:Uncharacterized protein n=1 Tax=Forsythia ovata TaxID=205694 RepID=A0ABD1X0V1_9LAMI
MQAEMNWVIKKWSCSEPLQMIRVWTMFSSLMVLQALKRDSDDCICPNTDEKIIGDMSECNGSYIGICIKRTFGPFLVDVCHGKFFRFFANCGRGYMSLWSLYHIEDILDRRIMVAGFEAASSMECQMLAISFRGLILQHMLDTSQSSMGYCETNQWLIKKERLSAGSSEFIKLVFGCSLAS